MCALLCARAQVLLFAALALTVTPASSVAQGRETLETRVSVNGDRVTLEWSKQHPWDAILLRSAPVLLAEYRTVGGQVVLDCLMGASDATARRRGAGCAGG